jgi:hypothetical protein
MESSNKEWFFNEPMGQTVASSPNTDHVFFPWLDQSVPTNNTELLSRLSFIDYIDIY